MPCHLLLHAVHCSACASPPDSIPHTRPRPACLSPTAMGPLCARFLWLPHPSSRRGCAILAAAAATQHCPLCHPATLCTCARPLRTGTLHALPQEENPLLENPRRCRPQTPSASPGGCAQTCVRSTPGRPGAASAHAQPGTGNTVSTYYTKTSGTSSTRWHQLRSDKSILCSKTTTLLPTVA